MNPSSSIFEIRNCDRAEYILKLMRQMFRFAVDRDIIEFDHGKSWRDKDNHQAYRAGQNLKRDWNQGIGAAITRC